MATLRMGEGSAVAAEYPLLILSIRVATFPESNRSPLVIPTEAKWRDPQLLRTSLGNVFFDRAKRALAGVAVFAKQPQICEKVRGLRYRLEMLLTISGSVLPGFRESSFQAGSDTKAAHFLFKSGKSSKVSM
jgi:hypothetical protein